MFLQLFCLKRTKTLIFAGYFWLSSFLDASTGVQFEIILGIVESLMSCPFLPRNACCSRFDFVELSCCMLIEINSKLHPTWTF